MANAIQPAPATPLVPATPSVGERWQALPGRTQALAVIGVAALLAVLVFMWIGARDSDYRILFPNLSEKDGGQVIDRLVQLNVPYKFTEGGTIMVPAARVPELRMKLAAAGLPSAASAGYELMDKNSFGQTQGQERMRIQRAIEGELTTTIQSLESVKSARVHLALPNQNGFFREQQKPSASVVLTLHPGRTLERSQIAGIVRVVSGSVPELTAKAVSVVDSTGTLLSGSDDDSAQGLDSQQLQFRREVEASHLKRVIALLEPVVGRDNVRASVSAEIDFSQVMQTAESYRPNQGADGKPAVRELRSEESSQAGSATPAGVPGATSNQPPVPATAPINGAPAPLQATGGNSAGSSRREAATRFEVDKTTTVTRNAVGSVRRLSAAVVVNHRASTDPRGKASSVPLTDKEIEQLTALVQQGIGFNAERGDQVKVVNAPFRVDAGPAAEELPLWKQPWLLDLLKSAAAPLALALVALVIILKLIRPALLAMLAKPEPEAGSQVDEVVGDDLLEAPPHPPALAAPRHTEKLAAARQLALDNPAAVANIVRGWVNGETA
ncbi:Flagellar M-ring protein [Rubrivivax sp. A210]|uniref:flagellar basal-body MS-ring/collar protein FliF n=1 Tax=Rubrivivax sp. A210 TaxID=2772301 RepID=UPI00191911D2|nr:flagellar basal-body MS-ring/collar protein FliF [Rubrivivax sp. A210]CAD5373623.1 Flagellar M-ring protein [Rubrivivax sp. A210]